MSDDLIKRSDAIKDLCDISNNSDMPEDWHRGMSVAISALYRVPPVPPADRPQDDDFKNFDRESLILLIECQKERIGELLADRPQGEWIGVEEDWRHQIEFWKCSECDFAVSSMYNYCPNCGARMKGADDE